jgi:hypothetical protein
MNKQWYVGEAIVKSDNDVEEIIEDNEDYFPYSPSLDTDERLKKGYFFDFTFNEL